MTRTLVFKLLRDVRLALLVVAFVLGGFQIFWYKTTDRVIGELSPFFTYLASTAGPSREDVEARLFQGGPAKLAKTITEALTIPTIGIGAGPSCDGQVLVLYDLLGLFDDFVPKFVKPYAHLKADALQALRRFREEVEQGKFPTDSESYH